MEKIQCLSSKELPEDSETHPKFNPIAILEGVMTLSNIKVFFWDTLYFFIRFSVRHPVVLHDQGEDY